MGAIESTNLQKEFDGKLQCLSGGSQTRMHDGKEGYIVYGQSPPKTFQKKIHDSQTSKTVHVPVPFREGQLRFITTECEDELASLILQAPWDSSSTWKTTVANISKQQDRYPFVGLYHSVDGKIILGLTQQSAVAKNVDGKSDLLFNISAIETVKERKLFAPKTLGYRLTASKGAQHGVIEILSDQLAFRVEIEGKEITFVQRLYCDCKDELWQCGVPVLRKEVESATSRMQEHSVLKILKHLSFSASFCPDLLIPLNSDIVDQIQEKGLTFEERIILAADVCLMTKDKSWKGNCSRIKAQNSCLFGIAINGAMNEHLTHKVLRLEAWKEKVELKLNDNRNSTVWRSVSIKSANLTASRSRSPMNAMKIEPPMFSLNGLGI